VVARFRAQVMRDLWWTKWHWGRFSPSASVSPGNYSTDYSTFIGRAIAQAVSRWLPTSAVRGSRPGLHVGFCGGQSGAWAGFLRVLRFPLPNSSHQLLQKIILIIIINQLSGICTIGQNGQTSMATVQGPNRHLGT
jgi:hypothetical protein